MSKASELAFGAEAEKEILTLLSTNLFSGVSLIRTQAVDDFDYAAVKEDKLVGYVEIKRRRISSTEHKDAIFPTQKLRTAIRLMEQGYKCYLVIQYADFIGVLDFAKLDGVTFSQIKRRDRQAPRLHCKVPVSSFKLYALGQDAKA